MTEDEVLEIFSKILDEITSNRIQVLGKEFVKSLFTDTLFSELFLIETIIIILQILYLRKDSKRFFKNYKFLLNHFSLLKSRIKIDSNSDIQYIT